MQGRAAFVEAHNAAMLSLKGTLLNREIAGRSRQ